MRDREKKEKKKKKKKKKKKSTHQLIVLGDGRLGGGVAVLLHVPGRRGGDGDGAGALFQVVDGGACVNFGWALREEKKERITNRKTASASLGLRSIQKFSRYVIMSLPSHVGGE